MNLSFKLGKISIPVTQELKIEAEGIEIVFEDDNLTLKDMPGILRELKEVAEETAPLTQQEKSFEKDILSKVLEAKLKGKPHVSPFSPNMIFTHIKEEEDKESSVGFDIASAILGELGKLEKKNPFIKE